MKTCNLLLLLLQRCFVVYNAKNKWRNFGQFLKLGAQTYTQVGILNSSWKELCEMAGKLE